MRVGDLDPSFMLDVAVALRSQLGSAAQVHVLSRDVHPDDDIRVTSSKLVELRNPLASGAQRPPLLVFVPNDLRTAAEDSFAEATFEQVSVASSYARLQSRLLDELPDSLRPVLGEMLGFLHRRDWPWADEVSVIRYLLSLKINGPDVQVAGAALCELGLVPDFHLLDQLSAATGRLAKNAECVELLTTSSKSERGRVLDLDLRDADFRRRLGDYLTTVGLEDPRRWTRGIVADERNWPLAFDKWSFVEGAGPGTAIRVSVLDVGLPIISEQETNPRLRNFCGHRVLLIGRGGPRSVRVKFRVDPAPERAPGLDHLLLQVIKRDEGTIVTTRKKKAWTGARKEATASFSGFATDSWDEGWHFVRIVPCTAEGVALPLVDDALGSEEGLGGQRANDSDLFHVLVGDDAEVELPQRAVQRFDSLAHAILHFRFKALAAGTEPVCAESVQTSWLDESGRAARAVICQIKFAGEPVVHVHVARVLYLLEREILGAPDRYADWRLALSLTSEPAIHHDAREWPSFEGADAFAVARRELFSAIGGSDGMGVIQSAHLAALESRIMAYAEAYAAYLGHALRAVEVSSADRIPAAMEALRGLLAIDTAAVAVSDPRGREQYATLASPLHPLRLLWLLCWNKVADAWLTRCETGQDWLSDVRTTLMERLALSAHPAVLPSKTSRMLTSFDDLHPFWTVYTAASDADPRGLLGEISSLLGLPEPTVGGFALSGQFLAARMHRYLVQHPYIRTLAINCFNPGRGRILADMLLELQREPELRDLRYDLRLFVDDPEVYASGADLLELITPSSGLSMPEADAFSTPTGEHLAPKLTFSVRDMDEFRAAPAEFAAHVSLLFDVFAPQDMSAMPATRDSFGSSVHGLVQPFAVEYCEDGDRVAWRRFPRHGPAVPSENASDVTDLLASLSEVMSSATASVATRQSGVHLRPVSTLNLEPEQKALLHQVHDVSDWVFTADRNLGIEFFDHRPGTGRPEYLIDHSPDFASSAGRRVVITSRSQTEVRVLFERVIQDYGLGEYVDRAHALLSDLRALSGRLALKLVASPNHRAEAFGLALAKAYLHRLGALGDQTVVPLDAHLELFRDVAHALGHVEDDVGLRRTDLALFDLDATRRQITCNLVEVKCYRSGGSLASLGSLKAGIHEQLKQSDRTIRYHFDPSQQDGRDRPDRLFKSHQLAALLEFYVDRGLRLGILGREAYDEAKFLLQTLDRGYHLVVTRSALIFDMERDGLESFVEENGIEYHRVGSDAVRAIIAGMPAVQRDAETLPLLVPEAPADLQVSSRQSVSGAARFVPRRRERTAPWETLTRGDQVTDDDLSPQTTSAPDGEEPVRALEPEAKVTEKPPEPDAVQPSVIALHPDLQAEVVGGDAKGVSLVTTAPDVVLGTAKASPQYGTLGKVMGRTVALDLNETHTISLFGVQGGGKSYTLGSIVEMATNSIPGINALPNPLATVVFHYSETQDYRPEFTSMIHGNDDKSAVERLASEYGASPAALRELAILVPAGKLAARKAENPGLDVRPLKFSSRELQAGHWRFLMGAVGNQATYIRRVNQLMRGLRDDLTLAGLRGAIAGAGLPDGIRELADMRLNMAEEYIDDSVRLGDVIRPGRLVIVDLRDEFIEKDDALGLFVVLLQIFSDATVEGRAFNKLVVFDEAHKYINDPDLLSGLVTVVREMRHKGTSILVASQDPPSVPVSLIELSSQIILHRFNSPAWLKHIQKANAALGGLTPEAMARLGPGEAYVWSSKATDRSFSDQAARIMCRPRVTRHGGATKTASGVDGGGSL